MAPPSPPPRPHGVLTLAFLSCKATTARGVTPQTPQIELRLPPPNATTTGQPEGAIHICDTRKTRNTPILCVMVEAMGGKTHDRIFVSRSTNDHNHTHRSPSTAN